MCRMRGRLACATGLLRRVLLGSLGALGRGLPLLLLLSLELTEAWSRRLQPSCTLNPPQQSIYLFTASIYLTLTA